MQNLVSIEFLTSTGIHKRLEQAYTKNDKHVKEIKDFLTDLQCTACIEISETPLTTRICEHTLCAYCYLKLDPKKCPLCKKKLPDKPEDGLYKLPRMVTNLLNNLTRNYTVKLEEKNIEDINKSSTQGQYIQKILKKYTLSDTSTISNIEPQTIILTNTNSTTFNYAEHNTISETTTTTTDQSTEVNDRQRNEMLHAINIVESSTFFDNLNNNFTNASRNITEQNTQFIDANTLTENIVNEPKYYDVSSFSKLNLRTHKGNIIITENQNLNSKIAITCDKQLQYNSKNELILSENQHANYLKLDIPSDFNKPIALYAVSGNITSTDRIKTGGYFRTLSGDITINVDIATVLVTASSIMGTTINNTRSHNINNILNLESLRGNITVIS